ncbi:rIIA protector from prophage-induced early lysis protein [Rhizobium phage RHph_X2_28B]|uniref:RIIA lysis inhibitor n=1 Tax=Rhizobium phage RHph_X2_28B TaxID=2836086 RepID=UPI00232924F5|nr:RIIA lysis inhibitor [Rhizobium phage RHph_X2_28B]QWY83502.1 rIIA protector from prophage-induced early lysis protein [Rhizobium phage RHph_X2_28B]QWY83738.1 rIIA protector from prophage-induced early lysis protein [Rhizobium phage RHph_X3_15]
MQVTHQQDYDTHAIIGGSEVMEFGVAQTAEFFTVLSSTLYSDKPLAVGREVLCNAWDSHIASKIIDTSVEVTIDDTKLVIRDFGRGIEHSKMQPIYCVYGNSTKGNDGTQTGGFGLGSKAPFAYSDHFTVTSHFMGTKTVYAISRGSAKTQGKPDCRVMVKVPTTESGLEVSIPLKHKDDGLIFSEIIRTIARMGEMNVKLNGERLETMPISSAQEGFYLTREEFTKHQERIFVRYGNVVYPVPLHEDYSGKYGELIKLLETLDRGAYRHRWKVIFQAPSNKISVTPSRESLSLTDTTIETIKELMELVPNINSKPYLEEAKLFLDECIELTWSQFKQYTLFGTQSIFNVDDKSFINNISITSYRDVVRWILRSRYPDNWGFVKDDMAKRLQSFVDNNVANKHTITAFIALMMKAQNRVSYHKWNDPDYGQWAKFVSRHITGNLAKKVLKTDQIDRKQLFIAHGTNKRGTGPEFTPFNEFRAEFDNTIHLLKNTIVVTYSRNSISENLGSMPAVKFLGNPGTKLVYIASRAKGKKDQAVEFFQKIGLQVLDLAQYTDDWAAKYRPLTSTSEYKEPKKPKIVGIPSLSNLIQSTGHFTCRGHMVENPHRIETPEFVFQPHQLSGASYTHKFFQFNDDIGAIIVKKFGHQGGITVNSRQTEKYIKDGAKEGYQWVAERLLEEFQTNAGMLKLVSFQLTPWNSTSGVMNTVNRLYQISCESDVIKNELGFPDRPNKDDLDFLKIWYHLRPPEDPYRYRTPSIPSQMNQSLNEIEKIITQQGIDPQLTVIKDMVSKSSLLKYLDLSDITGAMTDKKSTQKQKDDIESLLLIALQG